MTTNPPNINLLDIEKKEILNRYAKRLEGVPGADGSISSKNARLYLNFLSKLEDKLIASSSFKVVNRTTEDINKRELFLFELDILRAQKRMMQAQQFKDIKIIEGSAAKETAPSTPMARPLPQPAPRGLLQRFSDRAVEAYDNIPRATVKTLVTTAAAVFMAVGVGVANNTGALNKLSNSFNKRVASVFHRAPSPLVTAVLEQIGKAPQVSMPVEQSFGKNSILSSSPVFKQATAEEGSFMAGIKQLDILPSIKIDRPEVSAKNEILLQAAIEAHPTYK